jgi:hypothetical protein
MELELEFPLRACWSFGHSDSPPAKTTHWSQHSRQKLQQENHKSPIEAPAEVPLHVK